ncbi:hypothetical protein [Burkholderia ambifaria]|uniref:hypothetical protein n=1 Tax=Burkholderia ambifaria TaxID=152480 RepID=UPI00158AA108|nr:hypothetical protein [Burkholderia ambifaria]
MNPDPNVLARLVVIDLIVLYLVYRGARRWVPKRVEAIFCAAVILLPAASVWAWSAI